MFLFVISSVLGFPLNSGFVFKNIFFNISIAYLYVLI
jgi:hypothetical protein